MAPATADWIPGRRDRLARRRVVHGAVWPGSAAPRGTQTTVTDHENDGMRLQIRAPGDLQTLELAACDRVPPGPGQIEVAVSTSSINFADVLVAFGRYPTVDGRQPELGMDFVGVVTAVGADVIDHRVGDRVGGFSRRAAGARTSRATRAWP